LVNLAPSNRESITPFITEPTTSYTPDAKRVISLAPFRVIKNRKTIFDVRRSELIPYNKDSNMKQRRRRNDLPPLPNEKIEKRLSIHQKGLRLVQSKSSLLRSPPDQKAIEYISPDGIIEQERPESHSKGILRSKEYSDSQLKRRSNVYLKSKLLIEEDREKKVQLSRIKALKKVDKQR